MSHPVRREHIELGLFSLGDHFRFGNLDGLLLLLLLVRLFGGVFRLLFCLL